MDQVDLLIDLYDSIVLTCREVVGDVLSAGAGMGVHSEAGGHVEYEFDKRVERELSSVLSEEAADRGVGVNVLAEAELIRVPGDPVIVGLIDPLDGSRGLSYAAMTWPAYREVVGRGPHTATVVSLGLVPRDRALSARLGDLGLYGLMDHGTGMDYLAVRGEGGGLEAERSAADLLEIPPPDVGEGRGAVRLGESPPTAVFGFHSFSGWYSSEAVSRVMAELREAGFELAVEQGGSSSVALLRGIVERNLYLDLRAELARRGEGSGATLKLYDVSALPALYELSGLSLLLPDGRSPWDLPIWREDGATELCLVAGPREFVGLSIAAVQRSLGAVG